MQAKKGIIVRKYKNYIIKSLGHMVKKQKCPRNNETNKTKWFGYITKEKREKTILCHKTTLNAMKDYKMSYKTAKRPHKAIQAI